MLTVAGLEHTMKNKTTMVPNLTEHGAYSLRLMLNKITCK